MSNSNSIINWENLSYDELITAQADISKELLRRREYGSNTKSQPRRNMFGDYSVYDGIRFGDQERSAIDKIDIEEINNYIKSRDRDNTAETTEYVIETKSPKRKQVREQDRTRYYGSDMKDYTLRDYFAGSRPDTIAKDMKGVRPEEVIINDTVYTPVMSTQPRSRQVRTTTYELPPNTSIMPQEVVTVTTPVSSGSRSPVYRVKRNE